MAAPAPPEHEEEEGRSFYTLYTMWTTAEGKTLQAARFAWEDQREQAAQAADAYLAEVLKPQSEEERAARCVQMDRSLDSEGRMRPNFAENRRYHITCETSFKKNPADMERRSVVWFNMYRYVLHPIVQSFKQDGLMLWLSADALVTHLSRQVHPLSDEELRLFSDRMNFFQIQSEWKPMLHDLLMRLRVRDIRRMVETEKKHISPTVITGEFMCQPFLGMLREQIQIWEGGEERTLLEQHLPPVLGKLVGSYLYKAVEMEDGCALS